MAVAPIAFDGDRKLPGFPLTRNIILRAVTPNAGRLASKTLHFLDDALLTTPEGREAQNLQSVIGGLHIPKRVPLQLIAAYFGTCNPLRAPNRT